MLDKFLYFRIAMFSLLGYCTALAGPTFVDPRLPTHVHYGARNYPYAWVWWLFAPLAFLLPIVSLRMVTSKWALLVVSIAPLLVLSAVACLGFPPERPHMGVILSGLGFALVILLTVACRVNADDFAYLADTTLAYESRLEHVRATVTFWQMIAVYSGAGYLAFAVAWIYAMWFTTEKMVTSAADKFTLGQFQVALAVVITICVVVGPLLEAFLNAFTAIAKLSIVKR